MTPLDYEYLRKLLKERSGLDLSADKQYLVESRLVPLARRVGVTGIPELVQKIRGGGADVLTAEVVEAMTTNETFFFRDKIPFDYLREILPALMQARANRRSLRIWSAASSTGQEPYSIAMLLKEAGQALAADIGPLIDRFPVLITQHMPPTFTTILAEHLARSSHRPAHEAVDGEIVKAGQIYLAPGGRHMRVVRHGAEVMIALDDGPAVNFCKPAVDPLFTSATEVWQGSVMSVILTGMGSDGTRGGKDIVAAGGSVIAQDEATSVVWGMPGAAAHAGICAAVLPLNQIAPKLLRLFSGDRS